MARTFRRTGNDATHYKAFEIKNAKIQERTVVEVKFHSDKYVTFSNPDHVRHACVKRLRSKNRVFAQKCKLDTDISDSNVYPDKVHLSEVRY